MKEFHFVLLAAPVVGAPRLFVSVIWSPAANRPAGRGQLPLRCGGGEGCVGSCRN